jgi:phosphoglycerate dehydrogenase-like enzyme
MVNRVVVANAEFADAARAIGRDFPEFDLIVTGDSQALAEAAAGAVVIVTQTAPIGSDVLAQAVGLRLLVKMGRVYDHVDLDAVRARRVPFGLVPRKGPSCVAELALTLILSLSKDLIMAHRSVAEGAYRWRGLRPTKTSQRVIAFKWMQPVRLHEVAGKVLGCVGFGEINCELSLRARPLGMRVLYTRRRPLPPALEERYGVAYRPLRELLEQSDYVCVAVPHTDDTTHLIGADELRRLGPQGYLINVARGGVVDEEALVQALRDGTIAGAGLDVFTYEPLPADSPLCTLDNVILAPHIGGGTGTSREIELADALAEVRRVLNGAPLQYPAA